jgi:hypothetical protein
MLTVPTVLGDLPATDLGPTESGTRRLRAVAPGWRRRSEDALRRYGGLPGMGYLETSALPRLIRTGHSQLIEAALVHNPVRLLAQMPQ